MGKNKEAKRLAKREAEIAAELARREAERKAAEKAGTKEGKGGKKKKAAKLFPDTTPTIEELAARKAERDAKSPKAKTEEAARTVLADVNAAPEAHEAATNALDAAAEATHDETDAEIRARVKAKREERDRLAGNPSTSTLEALNAIADDVKPDVAIVETERGREFVAGTAPGDGDEAVEEAVVEQAVTDFAMPSQAPRRFEDNTNGNGQYKVKRPTDGKEVGYTRVTTYIDTLEDKTKVNEWLRRILLEGVAVNDTPDGDGRVPDPVAVKVRDLVHRRDVALAKARKADRKGKLEVGELATLTDRAWSEFKREVNALADAMLDLGGRHEKAQKGTDLHALCELYDREGIDAVGQLLTDGQITPADLADVEAYAEALRRAGIKIIPELIEQVVVIDDLKVGGRMDRGAMVKLPGMQRATRCVLDIKTGRIDFGMGKIAQQLEMYSRGQGYDEETGERTDLKLSRTKAVVVHLPAGTAKATVHVVDLTIGRKGNALSGEVRAFRNEGRRAIDLKVDLAAVTS